jgi:hypothetical protein
MSGSRMEFSMYPDDSLWQEVADLLQSTIRED